jgi:hypothetical protein
VSHYDEATALFAWLGFKPSDDNDCHRWPSSPIAHIADAFDAVEAKGIDPKTFDQVAQLSHFGWGLAIVTLPRALFHQSAAYIWFAGAWIAYCAVKEFWYDRVKETTAVRGSSLEDFLVAVAGALVAVVAILVVS